MTHTNHREGTLESLRHDVVVLVMPARGYNNDEDVVEKMRKAWDILQKFKPVNGGGIKAGCMVRDTPEQIRGTIEADTPMIHGVFTSEKQLAQVLTKLKEADLGISVVATGPVEVVERVAASCGLMPHSVEYSLGVYGKRELLAPDVIRQITTMCGHGLISKNLVKNLIDDIRLSRTTAEKAALTLGHDCECGIFNWKRAAELLSMAAQLPRS